MQWRDLIPRCVMQQEVKSFCSKMMLEAHHSIFLYSLLHLTAESHDSLLLNAVQNPNLGPGLTFIRILQWQDLTQHCDMEQNVMNSFSIMQRRDRLHAASCSGEFFPEFI
jgi:hypothetical protein